MLTFYIKTLLSWKQICLVTINLGPFDYRTELISYIHTKASPMHTRHTTMCKVLSINTSALSLSLSLCIESVGRWTAVRGGDLFLNGMSAYSPKHTHAYFDEVLIGCCSQKGTDQKQRILPKARRDPIRTAQFFTHIKNGLFARAFKPQQEQKKSRDTHKRRDNHTRQKKRGIIQNKIN